MGNKKRIRKLIQAKYKPSRKVTYFDHHKFGFELGKAAGNAAKQLNLVTKSFGLIMNDYQELYRRHLSAVSKYPCKSIILGREIKKAVLEKPRSTGLIVGETFVQMKSRKLPSIKEGMAIYGMYEDLDYVVGKCGKELGFEMPLQVPNSWQNVIHFRNGTIALLMSLDNPNSRRGLGTSFIM